MTREKAIKIVKEFINGTCLHSVDQEALETLIPELKESEDERIRKEIYNFFKNFKETETWKSISDVNTWLAYLEKQKEQKEIPLMGGDTDTYFDDLRITTKPLTSREWFDEGIKYAQRLQKEQKPELPKPHKGDDNNPYDMQVSEAQEYAIKRGFGIPYNDGEVYVDERHMTQTIGNILRWADEHPKEQKSIDYEAELKKCKDNPLYFYDKYVSIKQKPAECVTATLNGEPISTENYSVDVPLAEWSDEDERMLSRCIKSIETSKQFADSDTFKVAKDKEIDWLSALAEKMGFHKCKIGEVVTEWKKEDIDDKMVSKPKQEWSEEDEKYLNRVINLWVNDFGEDSDTVKWLKSLRPSWKPSEEQMKSLDIYRKVPLKHSIDREMLDSLYEQLKKLM